MAIDQAFIIQQIKKKETLYAAFCMNTKMPFIIATRIPTMTRYGFSTVRMS